MITPELASIIGAEVGTSWCHAATLRAAAGQTVPMGVSSVWVPVGNRQAIQVSRKATVEDCASWLRPVDKCG